MDLLENANNDQKELNEDSESPEINESEELNDEDHEGAEEDQGEESDDETLEYVEDEDSQTSTGSAHKKSSLRSDMHKYRIQRNEERGKNQHLEDKIAQLEAKIAAGANAAQEAPGQQDQGGQAESLQIPLVPDRYNFDDDDQYNAAVGQYNNQLQQFIAGTVTGQLTELTAKGKKESASSAVSGALDSFYDDAEKLKVKDMPEAVSNVIDEIGEDALASVVSHPMLKNTSMLVYSLGKSKAKLSEFKRLIKEDPVGATIWLAKQDEAMPGRFRQKTTRTTPDKLPDDSKGGGSKDLSKQAQRALDSGDPMAYARIVKEAAAAGVTLKVKD